MIDPLPSVLADGGLLVCFLVPVVVAVFGAIMFAAYKAEQRRRAAFEACEWLIKELKRTVPIWKKEVYADGETWVEGEQNITKK